MNIAETLQLKFPSAKFGLNGDIVLQDDGDGVVYIAHWNESLGAKPDLAQLNQWAIEMAPVQQAQTARQNRRNEYLPMGDQLDAILKYFETKEAQGEVLTPELKATKDQWRATKDKYPVGAK